jgi:hypothetical protein
VNREQTVQFLDLIGVHVPAGQNRTGWVVAHCPLGPWRHAGGKDKNPSFAIRLDPGDGFCNCFSCGFHGLQSDLILAMRLSNKTTPAGSFHFGAALQLIATAEEQVEAAFDEVDIAEVVLERSRAGDFHEFPEAWLESFPKWFEADIARDYLELRDVPFAVANMLMLRFDSIQNRICFPVRDFKGRLMGLHGRAIDEGVEPRYRMYTHAKRNNPLIWLGSTGSI